MLSGAGHREPGMHGDVHTSFLPCAHARIFQPTKHNDAEKYHDTASEIRLTGLSARWGLLLDDGCS